MEKLRKKILLGFYLRPGYIMGKMGECVRHPSVFGNYVKYGFKMLGSFIR